MFIAIVANSMVVLTYAGELTRKGSEGSAIDGRRCLIDLGGIEVLSGTTEELGHIEFSKRGLDAKM